MNRGSLEWQTMTETRDVAAARELLAGGVPFPLSREVEDRLVTAHEALVAADATREPVIVTVWQSQRATHIHSVTGAISTNADGAIQIREMQDREGYHLARPALKQQAQQFAQMMRKQLAADGPSEQQLGLSGHWVFDIEKRELTAAHHTEEAVETLRKQWPKAATAVGTVWLHEQHREGRTFPPVDIGPFTSMAGTWELDATREGVELLEGRDAGFARKARTWLLNQHDPHADPNAWQPAVGSAVRISHDGTLRERVSTTPSQVPWWGIDGIRRDYPLPIDGWLSGELRTDGPTLETRHPGGSYGLDARVRDLWVRELDGSLVRTVYVVEPKGRTLSSCCYRYHRSTTVPDEVFEIPAPRPELPEAPTLAGVWELHEWVEEPELVQFQDDEKDYLDRVRFWAIISPVEIPGQGWQPASGTRLTIKDDNTFTEEVTGECALRWWDEDITSNDRPTPFNGHVLENRGRKICLVPEGERRERRSRGESDATDMLFLRFDGSLVRVQSVNFDDGYMLSRVWLRYTKVG